MFSLPDDAEFSYTKRRQYARVNETGIFVTIPDETEIRPFGPEPVLHDQPTEIERAAVTLLCDANPRHPGLTHWIQALANDPDEFRMIDEYLLETPCEYAPGRTLADVLRGDGWRMPKERYDRDFSLFCQLLQHHGLRDQEVEPGTESPTHLLVARLDDAATRLAGALVDYREMGRPDGDQEHHIAGVGKCVTTSLAAAVVEYHERAVRAWSSYAEALEG
jgi:hypothetical protein